jgi:hypothetical protein
MTMTNPKIETENWAQASEPLVVTTWTVYALSMPKMVFVQVQGVAEPVRIEADKVETKPGHVTLKKGDTIVGEFSTGQVQGWWFVDSPR